MKKLMVLLFLITPTCFAITAGEARDMAVKKQYQDKLYLENKCKRDLFSDIKYAAGEGLKSTTVNLTKICLGISLNLVITILRNEDFGVMYKETNNELEIIWIP